MRDIEFRGKLVDTGEWVFGDLLHGNAHYPEDLLIRPFEVVQEYPVSPETVGQYTGLKDKNGVKIFEGDIVKDKWGNIGVIAVSDHFMDWRIVFYIGRDDLKVEQGVRIFDWIYPRINLEVIGNIYDNPELLEVNNGKEAE